MPIKFWDDGDGQKYYKAYFTQFENIWHHGDFIERTKNNGFIMRGRSDATLNPGGVRIGTAEIYQQVEDIDFITEGLVIGQDYNDDVRVILFVTTKNDEAAVLLLSNQPNQQPSTWLLAGSSFSGLLINDDQGKVTESLTYTPR